MRRVAPTRLGIEMSQNDLAGLEVEARLGQRDGHDAPDCQTTKPRNSAKIDQRRLRRAMLRPADAHWVSSSGSQWSIQRPGRNARAGAVVVGAVGSATCGGAPGLTVCVIGASGVSVTESNS